MKRKRRSSLWISAWLLECIISFFHFNLFYFHLKKMYIYVRECKIKEKKKKDKDAKEKKTTLFMSVCVFPCCEKSVFSFALLEFNWSMIGAFSNIMVYKVYMLQTIIIIIMKHLSSTTGSGRASSLRNSRFNNLQFR